jgi:hypothetical protein
MITYNSDGSVRSILTSKAGKHALEQAFKQSYYRDIDSRVMRVDSQVYQFWIDQAMKKREPAVMQEETRKHINKYILTHHSGYKIQMFCEVGQRDSDEIQKLTDKHIPPGFYIRMRPMSEREMKHHAIVQRKYQRDGLVSTLHEDPMWHLEMQSEEFLLEMKTYPKLIGS